MGILTDTVVLEIVKSYEGDNVHYGRRMVQRTYIFNILGKDKNNSLQARIDVYYLMYVLSKVLCVYHLVYIPSVHKV